MEEKKQITISLKVFRIILLAIIIIGTAIFFRPNSMYNQEEKREESIPETITIKRYNNQDYYIIKDDYAGEYDLQFIYLPNETENFEKKEVMSYKEYNSYCNKWGLNKSYSDISKNYIVFSYMSPGSPNLNARLAAVTYNRNNAKLYIWDYASGVTADTSAYCIVIPTERKINNIEIVNIYSEEYFTKMPSSIEEFFNQPVYKPIIYLYPTKESETSVKLLNEERITCSYPKYIDGWNVLAKPNGDLIDLDTGRNLYSLYYESESVEKFNVSQEGFIVKGEDSAKFLEEKLAILGLTEREAQEFIIYWLPRLEINKYNYIRFATDNEINNNMPLEINPNPDTLIRVLMTFKGLESPIEVEEQNLVTPERIGFTVVEWGGTEIK